jgi:hypothetical protein
MPIKPVDGADPLPLNEPGDLAVLIDKLRSAGGKSRFSPGLGDHFGYLAGVHPEWFKPYQEEVITELLDQFGPSFGDHCVLLHGAPDRCVDHLMARMSNGSDFHDAWTLAAIGTKAALDAITWHVRNGGDRATYEQCGVWIPESGPAQYRFTPQRRAVRLRLVTDAAELAQAANPVGLPIDQVARDPQGTPITWHYLSLRLAEVPGLPAWPVERVHLVSPRHWWFWALTARFDESGRYHSERVESDDDPDAAELDEMLVDFETDGGRLGAVELRPYDADLVYCNGHIQLTPDVVGTAGGPPIGIYDNPSCEDCGRLMFHVVSVEHHVRDYGDGWRSLFVCEDCQLVTCNATGWN